MGGSLGTHDLCGPAQTQDMLSVPFALNKLVHSDELQRLCETVAKCQSRSASFCRSSAGNR